MLQHRNRRHYIYSTKAQEVRSQSFKASLGLYGQNEMSESAQVGLLISTFGEESQVIH